MFEIFFKYGMEIKTFFGRIYNKKYLIEEKKPERRAWLTLLCNDEYLFGVLALIRSLKRSKTIYPLVVLIVEDKVSKEVEQQIINEGCSIKHIQDLYPKEDSSNLAFEHLIFTWTKLRAFEMTDVADKCVFLDADMIILQNLDELFQLEDNPDFAAVQTCICNPAKTKTYPEYWKPINCSYTYDNLLNINEQSRMFNSGLFLFHPNKDVFQEMLICLNTWDLSQFKFPDQEFLNKFYQNKWKCLPSIYNSLKTFSITHPNIWDLSKIKIIHYILAKPWDKMDQRNQLYENINKLWWDAFEYKSN
jgi:lipopolysaccharide biosynthesis glycosyltransferase